MTFVFDNSYARLPERFYARLPPSPVVQPELIKLNVPLARALGLDPDALSAPEGVAVFAGNAVPSGADPLAMAYAGHQFGNFVPQLGDGRAILLGEILAPSGERFDLQLKGAGRTPFSRAGDGRAWLGPVLREYLISEAMHVLGIPTTRALAAVTTGEPVYREARMPGAVLTRVSRSHVRIGTFEYFAARGDLDALRHLADYVIERHYPEARTTDRPYLALLTEVIGRQADLVARWLGVGFIHGVMNTDNLSIAGETIDYGPCAFMDDYHPGTVYSSIDRGGRYAYANQPRIAQWNLSRLAQTLLPLLDEDQEHALSLAQGAIDGFSERFEHAYLDVFRAKLGLLESEDADGPLITGLLDGMAETGADFTNSFSALTLMVETGEAAAPFGSGTGDPLSEWAGRWRDRLGREEADSSERLDRMRRANPLVIPRNHRVEEALDAAVEGDFDPFERLSAVLANPWEERPETQCYGAPPEPHQVVRQTFCGT
ncbi:protein adenylyltransferase SelO [Thiorhodococcus fuscus]|uniref:Protein nucleotidyltransferase YdiU n=1 Tax=Thiorhodococcus fuscus TaxID=527200 RepID=A0ABW4Y774_9GAMM